MGRRIRACGVLALLGLSSTAIAAPVALTRSAPWVVDYDEDACHLVGTFGEGDDQILVRFTRYEPGDPFHLIFYGRRLRDKGAQVRLAVDFGPVANPRQVDALGGAVDHLGLLLVRQPMRLDDAGDRDVGSPTAITPEQENQVTGLLFRVMPGVGFRLETHPMGPPMQALRTCSANLVGHWGYDAAEQAARLSPPVPLASPGTWLRSADYPGDMLYRGANGVVRFRLDVDATGVVSGCHVQDATDPPGFAALTCRKVTERARFSPARDHNGRPIASYYVNTVSWLAERP